MVKNLTQGVISNLKETDLICKFRINKIYPWKIWTVFFKNLNLFYREAIAAVDFAWSMVKLNPPSNNLAQVVNCSYYNTKHRPTTSDTKFQIEETNI